MATEPDQNILHVLVVGFHHKKGSQVEFCYPPLSTTGSAVTTDHDLPQEWNGLPSLAMPDGAHNVEKDTVMFLLPSLSRPGHSVYCVSCYRQINAGDLISKTDDVTRSSVQKSVCVISAVPLFGLLKAKLELITQAYFNERDFAKNEVLAEMYRSLCETVDKETIVSHALFGVSCRDVVRLFRHRTLLLFKAFLLERRILFFMFPVFDLCHSILGLLSLFPNVLEQGLTEATNVGTLLDAKHRKRRWLKTPVEPLGKGSADGVEIADDLVKEPADSSVPKDNLSSPASGSEQTDQIVSTSANIPKTTSIDSLRKASNDVYARVSTRLTDYIWNASAGAADSTKTNADSGDCIEMAGDAAREETSATTTLCTDSWGFPLSLFIKGNQCHPYLSLAHLDKLKEQADFGYVVGASNALFKQRKELFDAIVFFDDNNELQIEFTDADLRRETALSTADLRFMDFVLKHTTQDSGNLFTDGTGWEGGDEWVRLQFRSYLLSLMASVSNQSDQLGDFNESFVNAWRTTTNYRIWSSGEYSELKNAVAGHPFAGQLSVSDVKLRMEVSMANSESGRRLQQTIGQTGKYLGATGVKFKSWLSDVTKGSGTTAVTQTNQNENLEMNDTLP